MENIPADSTDPHPQTSDQETSEPAQQENENQRVKRTRKKPDFYGNPVSYLAKTEEPTTIQEALNSTASKHWKEAIKTELTALEENKTWELVDPPKGRKPIRCKWVFKQKTDINGESTIYKARLVAKGCPQRKGLDYDEIFSPVARYATLRTVLAIATHLDLELHQIDFDSAFLNGDLNEEVYMDLPESYMGEHDANKVCLLKKALYGLKQAGRTWYQRLDRELRKLGLKRSKLDACLYTKKHPTNPVAVVVYVDDLTIMGSKEQVCDIKTKLSDLFRMKDLGELKQIPGVKVERCRKNGTLKLSQEHYIRSVIQRFNMTKCNPVKTPGEPGSAGVSNEKADKVREEVPYRELVGALTYLATITRPDISYAVNYISKYVNKPTEIHWKAAKRVLRYLQGTASIGLEYKKGNKATLTGYADADWANDLDDRRSITGYVFYVHGCPIAWTSRKQRTVALSTTEAEYIALSSATQEAIWLKESYKILQESKRL